MYLSLLPLVLAAVLSVLSYLAVSIIGKLERIHGILASLSAGIFVSIIFANLLPLFASIVKDIRLYFVMLTGFVVFHVIEKFTYLRAKNQLYRKISKEQLVGFAIDHFITGVVLVLVFVLQSAAALILIFIPFLIHIFATAHPISHVGRTAQIGVYTEVALSMMTFVGALTATLLVRYPASIFQIFAFVLGALLYLVIRDIIPRERKGAPLFFILGALLTAFALIAIGV